MKPIFSKNYEYGEREKREEAKKEKQNSLMALRKSSRRLSLDIIKRSVSERSPEIGIFKYMDLRFPTQPAESNDNVRKVECECCGLFEDCTGAYIRRTRAQFHGKWFCGLCSEAVHEESNKLGKVRNMVSQEALRAHMEICKSYNNTIRSNPAMSLATAMSQILRKSFKKSP